LTRRECQEGAKGGGCTDGSGDADLGVGVVPGANTTGSELPFWHGAIDLGFKLGYSRRRDAYLSPLCMARDPINTAPGTRSVATFPLSSAAAQGTSCTDTAPRLVYRRKMKTNTYCVEGRRNKNLFPILRPKSSDSFRPSSVCSLSRCVGICPYPGLESAYMLVDQSPLWESK
jgi:hypothetical protein